MPEKTTGSEKSTTPDKSATTLPGTVQKIIHSPVPEIPEKAEIAVEGADELYKEIRIENTLTDEKGNEVKLKPGAAVEVTVEAPPEGVVPKDDPTKVESAKDKAVKEEAPKQGAAKHSHAKRRGTGKTSPSVPENHKAKGAGR